MDDKNIIAILEDLHQRSRLVSHAEERSSSSEGCIHILIDAFGLYLRSTNFSQALCESLDVPVSPQLARAITRCQIDSLRQCIRAENSCVTRARFHEVISQLQSGRIGEGEFRKFITDNKFCKTKAEWFYDDFPKLQIEKGFQKALQKARQGNKKHLLGAMAAAVNEKKIIIPYQKKDGSHEVRDYAEYEEFLRYIVSEDEGRSRGHYTTFVQQDTHVKIDEKGVDTQIAFRCAELCYLDHLKGLVVCSTDTDFAPIAAKAKEFIPYVRSAMIVPKIPGESQNNPLNIWKIPFAQSRHWQEYGVGAVGEYFDWFGLEGVLADDDWEKPLDKSCTAVLKKIMNFGR